MQLSTFFAAAAAVFGLGSATTTAPVMPQHCVTVVRSLSAGSTGADVVALQTFLGVKPTGYFGPMTQSTLVKWQLANHVITTTASPGAGVVGPKTRTSLKCTNTNISTPIIKPAATSSVVIKPVATSTPIAPQTNFSGGGGSGGSSAVIVAKCAPFTALKPAASQCETGPWIIINDEADCPVEWNCTDSTSTE